MIQKRDKKISREEKSPALGRGRRLGGAGGKLGLTAPAETGTPSERGRACGRGDFWPFSERDKEGKLAKRNRHSAK